MQHVRKPGATLRRSLSAVCAAAAFALACVAAQADVPAADSRADAVREQVAAILIIPADPAYGAYLAGDCVACHRQSGSAPGIPPIAGRPAEHVVRGLVEYRLGVRDNEVMVVRAARLGDEEIAALAAHFAAGTP